MDKLYLECGLISTHSYGHTQMVEENMTCKAADIATMFSARSEYTEYYGFKFPPISRFIPLKDSFPRNFNFCSNETGK